jgi:hypothetical protein
MRLTGIICSLALIACGSPTRVVVLRHPQTLHTVECRVDPWGSMDRTQQIESCKSAYEKAGYVVVSDVE